MKRLQNPIKNGTVPAFKALSDQGWIEINDF